jgi:hypothetical protein
MTRLAIVVLSLLFLQVPCLAGSGYLLVSGDATGSVCELTDNGGGTIISVYVIHKLAPGDEAAGSHFLVVPAVGSTWSFLSFQSAFASIPAGVTDIALGYGSCLTESTHIGTSLWLSTNPAPPCATLSLSLPEDGKVIADCAFNEIGGFIQPMIVNTELGPCHCYDATEPATWGSVKALYR